jgi:hypothetical protein
VASYLSSPSCSREQQPDNTASGESPCPEVLNRCLRWEQVNFRSTIQASHEVGVDLLYRRVMANASTQDTHR